MTPERARVLAKRWGRISWLLLVPAVVLFLLPDAIDDFGWLFAIGCYLCMLESRECSGWADGFEVAEKRLRGEP